MLRRSNYILQRFFIQRAHKINVIEKIYAYWESILNLGTALFNKTKLKIEYILIYPPPQTLNNF